MTEKQKSMSASLRNTGNHKLKGLSSKTGGNGRGSEEGFERDGYYKKAAGGGRHVCAPVDFHGGRISEDAGP